MEKERFKNFVFHNALFAAEEDGKAAPKKVGRGAVQVEPGLNPACSQRLKLRSDEPLSNFAFKMSSCAPPRRGRS